MRRLASAILVVFTIALASCSDNVQGTYKSDAHPGVTITLSKDGKFIQVPGGSGDYSIDGSNIVVGFGVLGSAKGKIESGKLIFPQTSEPMADMVAGTWVKE